LNARGYGSYSTVNIISLIGLASRRGDRRDITTSNRIIWLPPAAATPAVTHLLEKTIKPSNSAPLFCIIHSCLPRVFTISTFCWRRRHRQRCKLASNGGADSGHTLRVTSATSSPGHKTVHICCSPQTCHALLFSSFLFLCCRVQLPRLAARQRLTMCRIATQHSQL